MRLLVVSHGYPPTASGVTLVARDRPGDREEGPCSDGGHGQ